MRVKPVVLLIVVVVLASVLATFGGLLYRQTLRYIDFEADRFGFPYYWIERTLQPLLQGEQISGTSNYGISSSVLYFSKSSN